MRGARAAALLLALAACATSSANRVGTGEPREAEYAMRWDPAEGGPGTAAEVVRLLELSKPSEASYEVRYYDAVTPESAPDSARTIVRERAREGGAPELVLKYRRDRPLAGDWECALGPEAKRESQVDIAFGPEGQLLRVYSYSCAVSADEWPPALHATPRACTVAMTRTTAEDLKIERWELPGGRTLLEVSHTARNTEKELARFRRIYAKLIAAGAHPTTQSKTALSGGCRR